MQDRLDNITRPYPRSPERRTQRYKLGEEAMYEIPLNKREFFDEASERPSKSACTSPGLFEERGVEALSIDPDTQVPEHLTRAKLFDEFPRQGPA